MLIKNPGTADILPPNSQIKHFLSENKKERALRIIFHQFLKRKEDTRGTLGTVSGEIAAVLLDFVQIFWHLFISAFLVNKRSLIPPKCQQFELKTVF